MSTLQTVLRMERDAAVVGDLRRLVEVERMAVSAAGRQLGMPISTAAAVAKRNGIRPHNAAIIQQTGAATPAVIAALRAAVAEDLTITDAARKLGISRSIAQRAALKHGITATPAARKAGHRLGRMKQLEAHYAEEAGLLVKIEALRATVPGLHDVAEALGISRDRTYRIWNTAHPKVRFCAVKPKYEAPAPETVVPQRTIFQRIGQVIGRLSHTIDRQMTPEQRETKRSAIAHAKRTAVLPDVTADEAARLVAEYIARRGVTRCEPAYAAPVKGAGL